MAENIQEIQRLVNRLACLIKSNTSSSSSDNYCHVSAVSDDDEASKCKLLARAEACTPQYYKQKLEEVINATPPVWTSYI